MIYSLFGILLVLAFCDFNFVMKHFRFLKTVAGKGFFNLFLASMFLVGNNDSIWGWLMLGCFGFFGIFFILVGCACVSYDDADIKQDDVKKQAKSKLNSSSKESNTGDNASLLDDA